MYQFFRVPLVQPEGFTPKPAQFCAETNNIEFRRIGNRNGGYPEIFRDVGLAADHLREVAKAHPININKVVAVGHSTGGHLALWLAGRRNIPSDGCLTSPDPLSLKGVISLGGVNDLRHSLEIGGRSDILELLGGVDGLPHVAEMGFPG